MARTSWQVRFLRRFEAKVVSTNVGPGWSHSATIHGGFWGGGALILGAGGQPTVSFPRRPWRRTVTAVTKFTRPDEAGGGEGDSTLCSNSEEVPRKVWTVRLEDDGGPNGTDCIQANDFIFRVTIG